jgi:hypothetical protein
MPGFRGVQDSAEWFVDIWGRREENKTSGWVAEHDTPALEPITSSGRPVRKRVVLEDLD